ncbi:hypothetical protein [Streptacidiphilus monticola]|uniref:SUKH-3 domain containing protein n=1 Tax=Streptacidiphilus monticola TaxID=2161674 RepID=A0ABW1FZJ7_9ACTN
MMDLQARRTLLESSGLDVVDEAWSGSVPEPMAAWRPIISGDATPAARIPIQGPPGHLSEVQARWEQIASESGLFDAEGEFLVSVAGEGTANAPWALVRRMPEMVMAQKLGVVQGEPEFVAMSTSGHVVCGVTTEEYEVWILSALL